MNLSLVVLLLGLGCLAEPEMEYSRGTGALGVTDGPATAPEPIDTGDTGSASD